MPRFWKHRLAFFAAAAFALFLAGCQSESAQEEILVAYSGDCQGYLDPCG